MGVFRGLAVLAILLVCIPVSGTASATRSEVSSNTASWISAKILTPSEGATVSGNLSLTGEASSIAPVAEIQYSIVSRGQQPSKWEVMPPESLQKVGGDPSHLNFSRSLGSRALANGEFTILVRALDASVPQLVSAPVGVNVSVDNTPPVISVEAPASPVGGVVRLSGLLELETLRRIESVMLIVLTDPRVSALAELDRTTGGFSATLDVTGSPDGMHELVAQATYDGGLRVSSSKAGFEVRNPLSLRVIAMLAALAAVVAVVALLVAARIIEDRRLRSAGAVPRELLRESMAWRVRRALRRAPRIYGRAKDERAGGRESVQTIDAVELGRRAGKGAGWETKLVGKVTWRRSGTRATATVFEVDDWRGARDLGVRLLSLARKRMRTEALEELGFEVRAGRNDDAMATTLKASGARQTGEAGRGEGRVRSFAIGPRGRR